MISSLLALGAVVDARDGDGMTPLAYAVACEHEKEIELLVRELASAVGCVWRGANVCSGMLASFSVCPSTPSPVLGCIAHAWQSCASPWQRGSTVAGGGPVASSLSKEYSQGYATHGLQLRGILIRSGARFLAARCPDDPIPFL